MNETATDCAIPTLSQDNIASINASSDKVRALKSYKKVLSSCFQMQMKGFKIG